MVTAIVMIKAETGLVPETATSVAALDGVSEVYSVTGEWDLIAIARVPRHEDLADLIPGRLNKVHGVLRTETHTDPLLGLSPFSLVLDQQPADAVAAGHGADVDLLVGTNEEEANL